MRPQRRTPRDGGDEMASTGRLVFTNANLVDGEHPAKPGVTVVVEGERITSVGTGQRDDLAAADRVVDLAGRTLMPGHGHLPLPLDLPRARLVPRALRARAAARAPGAARRARTSRRRCCAASPARSSAGAPHEIDSAMKRGHRRAASCPGRASCPSGRELSTTGHGNDNSPYYWDVQRRGRGPALRRRRRVPPRGARRDQARRRDHQAVRHRRPRHAPPRRTGSR